MCTLIKFYGASSNQIVELLKKICMDENILADIKLLKTIADRCKGDIRSAINDLQSVCLDKQQVDIQSLDVLGYRDRDKIIFDALRDVFKARNIQSVAEDGYNDLVPPDTFSLWISENLPREYVVLDDLMKGYELLSKADVFLGRVHKRQYYGFWSYAYDLMKGGVATAKTHNYTNTRYYYPTLITMKKNNKPVKNIADSVIKKIGVLCHSSTKKSKEFLLLYFRYLFRNDIRFAVKMKNKLNLSESEIKYLLGEKYLHKLKNIIQSSEKTDEKQIEIEEVVSDIKKKEKEIKQKIKQPSIFDF